MPDSQWIWDSLWLLSSFVQKYTYYPEDSEADDFWVWPPSIRYFSFWRPSWTWGEGFDGGPGITGLIGVKGLQAPPVKWGLRKETHESREGSGVQTFGGDGTSGGGEDGENHLLSTCSMAVQSGELHIHSTHFILPRALWVSGWLHITGEQPRFKDNKEFVWTAGKSQRKNWKPHVLSLMPFSF